MKTTIHNEQGIIMFEIEYETVEQFAAIYALITAKTTRKRTKRTNNATKAQQMTTNSEQLEQQQEQTVAVKETKRTQQRAQKTHLMPQNEHITQRNDDIERKLAQLDDNKPPKLDKTAQLEEAAIQKRIEHETRTSKPKKMQDDVAFWDRLNAEWDKE